MNERPLSRPSVIRGGRLGDSIVIIPSVNQSVLLAYRLLFIGSEVHTMKMVTHRYTFWIDVPAISGDGWNSHPDYSAAEIGRALRRAIHANIEHTHCVEHADTTERKD